MKPSKIIILGCAIAILTAFSGCAEKPTQEVVTTQPQAQEPSIEGETQVAPSESEQEIILSEADSAAYDAALEVMDTSFCDKIDDAVIKGQCVIDVKDRGISKEALNEMDKNICSQLSTDDRKEACEIQIEAEIAIGKKREEEVAKNQAENSLMAEIIKSGNVSRCSEITDAGFFDGCEMSILTNKATEVGDVSICNQVSSPESREVCKENAQIRIDDGL